ncbi:DUF3102 domain-containing protein [Marinobacter shengliensis]
MARKPTNYEPEIAPAPTNTEVLTDASQSLAVHSSEIMERFGDGLPYDRARLVNEAKFYMAQSAEAMLEAGKRLILLKENEPHGDFTDIVESKLGLAERTARLMMQATIKYSSPQLESKRQTFAVLGKSKLFELMIEDDEDLAELAEGGTVAGLTLDDVDRMSVRELRRSLREARENAEARAKVLSDKNSKIDALDAELTKLKSKPPLVETLPPDEMAQRLSEVVARHAASVLGEINRCLLPALRALDEHDHANGTRHNVMAAGLVAQIETRLAELRADFDLPRHLDGDATPDWLRDDAEEVIQKAIESAGGTVQ